MVSWEARRLRPKVEARRSLKAKNKDLIRLAGDQGGNANSRISPDDVPVMDEDTLAETLPESSLGMRRW
jgi:hypothetical protein